jgi:hypothetical protein
MVIQWSFSCHSVVIQWSFNGHSVFVWSLWNGLEFFFLFFLRPHIAFYTISYFLSSIFYYLFSIFHFPFSNHLSIFTLLSSPQLHILIPCSFIILVSYQNIVIFSKRIFHFAKIKPQSAWIIEFTISPYFLIETSKNR